MPAEPCPACGESGMKTLFSATDRLYETTNKHFLVVECSSCRLMRLYPQPTPLELGQYYPAEYWYAPATDTVTHIEEMYRRLVLRDHVNFVEKAITNSAGDGYLFFDCRNPRPRLASAPKRRCLPKPPGSSPEAAHKARS